MKFQIRIFLGLVRGIAWMLKNERKKESVHCGVKELELHSADRENSRSTKDFSTRWKSPFHSFMRLRFERVSLLRFSLQKVCSTRRSKTVPVFLKRNWIHKSVEGSRSREGCTLLSCVLHNARFCSQGSLKVVSHVRKRECHAIFSRPRISRSFSRYFSASRFHFHASFTRRDPPFQLKTFDFPRRVADPPKRFRPSFRSFDRLPTCWREIRCFMASYSEDERI